MLWSGEWFPLTRRLSAEPHQTLSSLPKERQLNENMGALAHGPIKARGRNGGKSRGREGGEERGGRKDVGKEGKGKVV